MTRFLNACIAAVREARTAAWWRATGPRCDASPSDLREARRPARLRAIGPLCFAAVAVGLAALAAPPARAQDAPPPDSAARGNAETSKAPIVPASWLVLESPDRLLRRPLGPNVVFARYLLARTGAAPRDGEEVTGERGVTVKWKAAEAKDGVLDAGGAAYGFTTVTCDADGVWFAEMRGVATLWVNGDPFAGDVYGYGLPLVPAMLRRGENRVFVAGFRGPATVRFTRGGEARATPVQEDATVPAFAAGETPAEFDAGVVVRNPTGEWADVLVGDSIAGEPPVTVPVRLPPLGVTKVPLRLRSRADSDPPGGALAATYEGERAGGVAIRPKARESGAPHRLTRVSEIDGSVQEYAVLEPAPSLAPVTARVVLTLHGAGVDSVGQAAAYSRRPGTWIVAPTNRRPFGFDWQDWGRLDAYEALGATAERFGLDPMERVFLTGHSMGGHGTWHLAVNDPDRFLAIAPSAGWASFDTYAGGPRPATPLSGVWRGADAQSDTLALAPNLVALPVFVVHGTADDNVPVAQAELMLRTLREAGGSPGSHFEKDAGHWWDGDKAPGADCVDLPAVFDFFARTVPPDVPSDFPPIEPVPDALDWTTADSATDSRHHWIQLAMPMHWGEATRIRAAWDRTARVCTVTTSNARRMNLAPPDADRWTAMIDGESVPVAGPNVWFERHASGWEAKANVQDDRRKPSRSGPFKRAFDRRFAAVFPTRGTPEETAETTARVRSDAGQWWVRGNGFFDIVRDTDVLAHPDRFAGRNLVLYGNADTNAAWEKVLGEFRSVDAARGRLRIGDREYRTSAAALLFILPRRDDAVGMAGAVADTGPGGTRVGLSQGFFGSGVGIPDYVAWDERVLTLGDGATIAAGFFDPFWRPDDRGFFSFGGERVPDPSAPGGK